MLAFAEIFSIFAFFSVFLKLQTDVNQKLDERLDKIDREIIMFLSKDKERYEREEQINKRLDAILEMLIRNA